MENFAYKTISQSWMSLDILVKRVNTRQVFARAVLPVEVLTVSVDVEKFINTIFWSKAYEFTNIGSYIRDVVL